MHRAYVEKGSWQIIASAACNPSQQKLATLRVSAFAGIAAIALMMGPDLKQMHADHTPIRAVISTAPDIIPAKSMERVPEQQAAAHEDITSTAPTRRWRSQTDPNVIATPRPSVHAAIEVMDGATLRAGEMVVRLAGLSLPTENQTCRRLDGLAVSCIDRAVSYLQLLVKGRSVACERAGVSDDGIEKGRCRIGDSDIAEQMVRQGWAKAEVSTDIKPEERFLVAEAAAKKQKLGIWR
ncbi:MAG: thermonuclease family protein [Beijerinckiaceae bacterium]